MLAFEFPIPVLDDRNIGNRVRGQSRGLKHYKPDLAPERIRGQSESMMAYSGLKFGVRIVGIVSPRLNQDT